MPAPRSRNNDGSTGGRDMIAELRFAADSPLEGTGFELSVPREIGLGNEALSFICRQKSWRSAEGTHSARGTSTATNVGRASQEGGLRFGLCRDRQGTA